LASQADADGGKAVHEHLLISNTEADSGVMDTKAQAGCKSPGVRAITSSLS